MRKLAGLLGLITCAAGIVAPLAVAEGSSPQFTFGSDEPGTTFECSLDGAPATSCASPQNYNNLSAGPHTLVVMTSFTVPTGPPTNTALPVISGTAQEGSTLSTTNGSWTGNPTFSYQWQDCSSGSCSNIAGATASTYKLQASEVGDSVTVVVTGMNSGGSAKATANAVGPVTASPPPTASFAYSPSSPATGMPVIFDGSASTCAAPPCTYAWNDKPPGGGVYPLGSGQTMNFTFQHVGTKFVHLAVTDAQGRTADVEHDVTVGAAPPPPPTPPSNTAKPTISGTAQQGSQLTASQGTWSGTTPMSYAYQWQRCSASCSNISGATASTYTPVAGDAGDTLDVKVTASNSVGNASATSAKTATIAGNSVAPSNTAKPTISGTAQQGSQLTASQGTWSGTTPMSYAYQWQRCSASCSNISGATASTYTPVAGDIGDTLDVKVTASNSAGSGSATSSQTASVAAPSGGGGSSSCDLNATPSNFTAQVAAATAGQTICLGSGNYGTWSGGTTKALTITAQSGASPTFCWDLYNTSNLTIDGGHTNYDPSTPGINADCHNNIENSSRNITVEHVAFADCHNPNGACFDDEAGGPSTIMYNIFHDFPACTSGSCTGLTEGVFHMYQSDTNPADTLIEWNLFTNIAADAIDVGDDGTILGNDFLNVYSPPSDPRHTDVIQWSSTSDHDVIVKGNFIANGCVQGLGAYDGTSNNTITDNVIIGCSPHSLVQAADTGSLVAHNTVVGGGGVECGSKTGSPPSTTKIQDNILQQGINWGGVQCTPSVDNNNMSWPSYGQIHSSSDFIGTPQFVGGSNPTTYAGYD